MNTTTLRPAFLAVLVSISIGMAQADDDNRSGAFGVSLPSVNDSAFGYGKTLAARYLTSSITPSAEAP